jgi:DNA polymerase-1
MDLYLIDGHAVVYRYYFAYQKDPLKNSKGEVTSSMFGMAKLLTTLFKKHAFSHIGVIFDSPYKTWRKEIYAEYKAGRKTEDDVRPMIEKTYLMCKKWGIYSEAFKGLEADDVIMWLAKKAESEGAHVTIVTRDKDYCQVVSDNIKLLDLGKTVGKDEETIINKDMVLAKYGVLPTQIPDYLALIGDTSDNIPGVKGIGPKGAVKLLSTYGSVDGILKGIDNMEPKEKARFDGNTLERDLLLTRYKADADVHVTWDELKRPPIVNAELLKLLEYEFEFNSIIKELVQ